MELLTASRLRARDDCARLEWWLYNARVRPVHESETLRIGSLVHLGLEWWYLARREYPDMPDHWLEVTIRAVAGRAFDAYEQAKVEEMLSGYHAFWHAQPLDVVVIEHQFVAPVLNPETSGRSRTFAHAGKIDGIVRDAHGRHLLLEHKTAGEEIDDPSAGYWEKLAMDSQVSLYYLGAESAGYRVEGCLYDVLKKPGLRPFRATPEESRKYTQPKIDKRTGEILEPARLYANQRESDETPDEYRARLREAIASEPARYYTRREIPRLDSQLEEFMHDAWSKAAAIREAHNAVGRKGLVGVPRTPAACHRFGRCFLWDVCSAGVDPDHHPDRFRRLEWAHPELDREFIDNALKGEESE